MKGSAIITLILGGIFALAFFVRSYFVYDLALKDFLVSGGSDAYYYGWIIEHVATTGKHLLRDSMLNYPLGMPNPRPPVYAWSVALTGIFLGHLQGSIVLGIWQSFLFSTALWGALTIFPTYFLGRDVFGKRAGLVAAFFLALLPAHIQRSPLSNGDHDALVLFFVVTAFYFFLKALSELKQREWVKSWTSPTAVLRGFRQLILENKRTVLFSIMAGTSVATVALTWQGWAYVPVVIMAYFIVQLLVHKVKNQDPLGVLLVFTVTLGSALLLAAPYYAATGFVRTWFDVPLILFAASIGLGILFTIFHRLPWVLVIPPIVLGFSAGLAIASLYSPTVGQALTSGFGYFAPNKVFETIAEAQPPELSQAILSFGAVTYYLAIFGIGWMAIQFVRRPRSDYLFALAWSAAAIFMAMSAVRFIFNASPAFAITSGWVTVMIVERLGFEEVRKAVASTGGSRLAALRKGIKARHIAGTLFIAFLLILPNTWYAVDAAVPFERKQELDIEVYRSIPEPLRPPGYQEGSLFYFGAFGYSLPLKSTYFPKAWEWLRQQDADTLPLTDRPAFLSWWDYGFEAIQEGRHPTVADNFQNGFEFAGHFLTAQSENEGIAILNVRLLEGDLRRYGGEFSSAVRQALQAGGLDHELVRDVIRRPLVYIPLIRSDPERFGEWDVRLSNRNAMIVYLKIVLTENLDVDGQADLYRDLRTATGHSVEYFAVDSRLVPLSGTNTGIFYAPVKLTDHITAELPDQRSIPIDFYRLVAETDQGEFDLDKVPPAARITNVRIEYKDMFYNSLLYRIFFGQKGSDVGLEDDGLPSLSGALAGETPMNGWMLNHFRLAYRTAYFNPHPSEDVANHTEDWTAMNLFDALELQGEIQRGEAVGTVDISPTASLVRGVAILKYYDGAVLRGRVTTQEGRPLEGVRMTVLDEVGVPHDVSFSDSRGFYELGLPYGEVRVVASSGSLDGRTQTGGIFLGERVLQIREDQAARLPHDLDGDGLLDFILEEDFSVRSSTVRGIAFMDLNENSVMDAEEEGLGGLVVEIRDGQGNVISEVVTGPDGRYEVRDLLPDDYEVVLVRQGASVVDVDVSLSLGQAGTQDLAVPPARITGRVLDEFRQPAAGGVVEVVEKTTDIRMETTVDEEGRYTIEGLFESTYALKGSLGERESLPERIRVFQGVNSTWDLTVRPMGNVSGRTLLSFRPAPFVTLTLERRGEGTSVAITTDATGRFSTRLPEGVYDVYSLHFESGRPYSFLGTLTAVEGSVQTLEMNLLPAIPVGGLVTRVGGVVSGAPVTFELNGAPRTVTSDGDGSFLVHLPQGVYRVWSLHDDGQYAASFTLREPTELDVSLSEAASIVGRVFRDLNGNGTWDEGEGLEGARLNAVDASDRAFSVITGEDGEYEVPLLEDVEYTLNLQERGYQPLSLGPLTSSALANESLIELQAESVRIEGRLLSLEDLEVDGTPVVLVPVRDGAVLGSGTADATGFFSVDLIPGLYSLVVDSTLDGDDTRLQNLAEVNIRVPVGKTVDLAPVEVVKRVRVEGQVELDGSPFEGNLYFRGPEEMEAVVEGNFTVYLRPGNYTLFASSQVQDETYVLLNFTPITSPLSLNLSLDEAALLTGIVRAAGSPVTSVMTLNFLRDGARLATETATDGSYFAALAPGAYEVSLDWRGVDRVDDAPRFVRYSLSQEIEVVAGESKEINLELSRFLDNSTLTGTVLLSDQAVSARLTFLGATETTIDATFDVSGAFNISLAPGVYSLYAYRETGRSVSLRELEVLPHLENAVTLELEPGYRVAGIVSLEDGSKERSTVEFTSSASVMFTTDESGSLEAYLPSGLYDVKGETQRLERGVRVDYGFASSLELKESTTLNLRLLRVDMPGVVLEWDPSQRGSMAAGDSVVYTLTLRNAGNLDDTFRLDAALEGWIFDFKPRVVTLPFGVNNEAAVAVRITSPEGALVDHEPLLLEASSTSGTGARDALVVDVDIHQTRGIALRLSGQPPSLSPEALEYQLEIFNDGNGRDAFALVLTNPHALASQGWQAMLLYGERSHADKVEGIEVPAQGSAQVTLKLEVSEVVSGAEAVLLAFSEENPSVEDILKVKLAFPSLSIPAEDVDVQGRNLRLGPPEFPVFLYATIAITAALVAILFIRRRRRRYRR